MHAILHSHIIFRTDAQKSIQNDVPNIHYHPLHVEGKLSSKITSENKTGPVQLVQEDQDLLQNAFLNEELKKKELAAPFQKEWLKKYPHGVI